MQRQFRPLDLAQVTAIVQSIAGQMNFRAVIHAASNVVQDILPHVHLDVALTTPDGRLVTAYETGLQTEWDADTTASKPVETSPIRTLLRGQVDHILTEDAQADPRFHFVGAFSTPIFAVGLRGRLHVPLKVEGRVFGALSFSTQDRGSYQPADIANARIVAEILSGYFSALQQSELARRREIEQVATEVRAQSLRTGARQLTEALENARKSIGMDLHDQTLADLTRIARSLKRLSASEQIRGQELHPLEEDISHCLRELRVIIDDARPAVLELFGFVQAVEALLEQCAQTSPTPLRWTLKDQSEGAIDQLPQPTQVALYRIVQEAINNAGKHARAGRLDVVMAVRQKRIVISVRDDGGGIGKIAGRPTSGLRNMTTRAALIDAELDVRSTSKGTEVRLRLVRDTLEFMPKFRRAANAASSPKSPP
ncbi:MAG: ATP-binding protein [bacterium]